MGRLLFIAIVCLLVLGGSVVMKFKKPSAAKPYTFHDFLDHFGLIKTQDNLQDLLSKNERTRRLLKEKYAFLKEQLERLMEDRSSMDKDLLNKEGIMNYSINNLFKNLISASTQEVKQSLLQEFSQVDSQKSANHKNSQTAQEQYREKTQDVNQLMRIAMGDAIDSSSEKEWLKEQYERIEDQQKQITSLHKDASDRYFARTQNLDGQVHDLIHGVASNSITDTNLAAQNFENLQQEQKQLNENRLSSQQRLDQSNLAVVSQLTFMMDQLSSGTEQNWRRSVEKSGDQITQARNQSENGLDATALREKQADISAKIEDQRTRSVENMKSLEASKRSTSELLRSSNLK